MTTTIARKVLHRLEALRPDGRCDDCLSVELDIVPRQAVNMVCRPLQASGVTARRKAVCSRCGRTKLVNALVGSHEYPVATTPASQRLVNGVTNHQRIGSISNAHVGRDFEDYAQAYFADTEGLALKRSFSLQIGHGATTKGHRFDLGNEDPAILVECKSHNWTITGNMPSAKVTVWNEAMYYFHLAPARYRKVLFVLSARHSRQGLSLAEWYVRTNRHLIPEGVSIIEYDVETRIARCVIQ